MQLLLYSGPARQLSSKVKLSKKVYDPESSGKICNYSVDHVIPSNYYR